MSDILYLEHSKERHGFESALKKVPAFVTLITEPTKERLEIELSRRRYDLVVTDAYFLREDEDHEGGTSDDTYRLGDIVRQVRAVDNKRVQIAVLTDFSTSLLDRHRDDLELVDYIWDKRATPDFVYWQAKRILQENRKAYPNYRLVDELLSILAVGEDSREMPWRVEMEGMLAAYRKSNLEAQQMAHVKESLRRIASILEVDSGFDMVFKKIESAEPLNIAADPLSWGHLRHVLNVFWLGYYLLNTGLFDLERVAKKVFRNAVNFDTTKSTELVNGAWFLASIFHDVGMLGQRADKVIERCNDVIEIYGIPEFKVSLANVCSQFGQSEKGKKITGDLQTMLLPNLTELYLWANNKNNQHFDHGFLSGLTILKLFGGEGKNKFCGEAAAIAAAMHNFLNVGIEEARKLSFQFPQIDFDDYPLIGLLVICDQLEIWDRTTGMENEYSGTALECCELAEIKTVRDQQSGHRQVSITLNYIPFRNVVPGDSMEGLSKEKIGSVLSGKVKPVLNRVSFKPELKFGIDVTFRYNGRNDLDVWRAGISL